MRDKNSFMKREKMKPTLLKSTNHYDIAVS
nr:MAG TPA: hypothetical protein [Caudoviricetes sp.]